MLDAKKVRLTAKENNELKKICLQFQEFGITIKPIVKFQLKNGKRYILENAESGVYLIIDTTPKYAIISYIILPNECTTPQFVIPLFEKIKEFVKLKKHIEKIFVINVSSERIIKILKDIGYSLEKDALNTLI